MSIVVRHNILSGTGEKLQDERGSDRCEMAMNIGTCSRRRNNRVILLGLSGATTKATRRLQGSIVTLAGFAAPTPAALAFITSSFRASSFFPLSTGLPNGLLTTCSS
jgi:hypothetical protein